MCHTEATLPNLERHLQLQRTRPPFRVKSWHLYGFATAAGGAGALLSSVGLAWVVVPVAFVGVIGVQGWFARTLHRYRVRAFECLDVGDYEGARAVYDELARRRNVHFKIAGLLGLATIALRRGDADRARALFGELRGNPTRVAPMWTDMASEYLAMCATLAGDFDDAEGWLDDCRALTPLTATAYAVLGVRAAQYEDTARIAAVPLRRSDRRLFSHEVRVFHLMRSFATAQLDQPSEDDRMLARPAFDTEYDYLTADWPELRDYLAAHPLPSIGVADDSELPRARLLS